MIVVKSKLIRVKSIISKTIQEFYISEKDYAFISEEVNRYNKLKEKIRKKIKSQLKDLKEKSWLSTDIKKVSMNLLKIYVIMKCINKKKSVVLCAISIKNSKNLKYHPFSLKD